jgi:hypothetical protein
MTETKGFWLAMFFSLVWFNLSIRCQATEVASHRVPFFLRPSDILHPTSDILHPTSDILHPTSDIAHPLLTRVLQRIFLPRLQTAHIEVEADHFKALYMLLRINIIIHVLGNELVYHAG